MQLAAKQFFEVKCSGSKSEQQNTSCITFDRIQWRKVKQFSSKLIFVSYIVPFNQFRGDLILMENTCSSVNMRYD